MDRRPEALGEVAGHRSHILSALAIPGIQESLPDLPFSSGSSWTIYSAMNLSVGRSRALALLALVVGVGVSFAIFSTWRAQIERDDGARLDRQVTSSVVAIRDRLDDYENALGAERAYLGAAGNVERDDFRVFADGLQLSTRYPGMQGIGFQAYVRAADLDAFVRKARGSGAPDFTIMPPGRRSEYFVVLFNEPAAKFGATWGFDARSNPTVRPYLERARDTGRSTLSGKAVLGVDLKLPKAAQPVAFGLLWRYCRFRG